MRILIARGIFLTGVGDYFFVRRIQECVTLLYLVNNHQTFFTLHTFYISLLLDYIFTIYYSVITK
jgi:hypothetical protein